MKKTIAFPAIAVLGIFWGLFYHGAAHIIGIDTQLSEEYAFFSGFGTFLLGTIGFGGTIATVWHHLNCHTDGCGRIGKFPVAGGQYKVCRRCHRQIVPDGHHHLTLDVLRKLHHEHHHGKPVVDEAADPVTQDGRDVPIVKSRPREAQ